ncbi:amidohydrolase [Nonlabens marinus]|uniref:Exoenzymes regulatory protein AepA n=1 Tax=Nonlabens marinus S1-08 TaxID=1454201 RepID=W8VR91_9FLAO|nr:amidohydrolase [Nonlabens marinus]BAO55520.1 exoenzymes regulatory protein AepA precursor [Nonlabens marinus S1-08]
MKKISFFALLVCLISCQNKDADNYVDAIYQNGTIYTVDNEFSTATAMAVRDGKIIAVGSQDDIDALNLKADTIIDLAGQFVYPGLIDAHCHFYRFGQQLQQVDLVGTTSYQEVLDKVEAFQEKNNTAYIIGRGWDQNDWDIKEYPTKAELSELFPDTPVALTRIDGHAMIVNDAALKLAGIDRNTPFSGGDIEQKDGELTGILVDNPMELIEKTFPVDSRKADVEALMDAQEINFSYGLTTVDDAGLNRNTIELIDSLQQAGALKMKVYAMVSNTPENLDYYLDKGIIKTDRLNVRSIKFYADGALGSRGAAMKEEYSDRENHFGALLSSVEDFKKTAERIAATDYQMNTHAIGDSANVVVLKTYRELLNDMPDRRWRVEHAQIISPADFEYFDRDRILPSVQPTHATSDMYWAEDRVGAERIKGAYAYQKLLDQSGMVALGTDYPVEQVNPFLTFYAAVARQDTSVYPENGFNMQDALSREDALRGMTIWAAYSNFEEKEKGSLEKGKSADFMILKEDLMKMPIQNVPTLKVQATYINGEKVY